MDLMHLLQNDRNILRLFSTLPDLVSHSKTYQYRPNEELNEQTPYKTSNRKLLKTAYRIWFSAYIQRINKMMRETDELASIHNGINKALQLAYITKEECIDLLENIRIVWNLRASYIKDKNMNQNTLLKGCLFLAQFQETYETDWKPKKNYYYLSKSDLNDLSHLVSSTEKTPKLFQSDKGFLLAPSFDLKKEVSKKISSDYVIGNMLVDIQVETIDSLQKNTMNHLLSCYLLSTLDESFPAKIKQIGIYYPLCMKLVFLDIADIEKHVNLENFSSFFQEIIQGKIQKIGKMNYADIKMKIIR